MRVFKVRNKNDGKFSCGGFPPKFSRFGKIWQKEQHLKSHITQLQDMNFYDDEYEVIEYDLVVAVRTDAGRWIADFTRERLEKMDYNRSYNRLAELVRKYGEK